MFDFIRLGFCFLHEIVPFFAYLPLFDCLHRLFSVMLVCCCYRFVQASIKSITKIVLASVNDYKSLFRVMHLEHRSCLFNENGPSFRGFTPNLRTEKSYLNVISPISKRYHTPSTELGRNQHNYTVSIRTHIQRSLDYVSIYSCFGRCWMHSNSLNWLVLFHSLIRLEIL